MHMQLKSERAQYATWMEFLENRGRVVRSTIKLIQD